MKNEAQQLLKDSNIKPTDEIINNGLGETSIIYKEFLEELKKYGITLMEWRYYNDGKAWLSKGEYKWTTSRGTNKVKPIFWLSIWEGFFKVSFSFSEKVKDEILGLGISKKTREVIVNTELMGKKMKYLPVIFDVYSAEQFSDIFKLAEFRKEKI
ncbi:DUF3788 domain-containing protein [Peptostreptococcaceae bacterium OttesenSCG-928-C18]|nr:DUF3788 domain-containing protein [Peptostreptococcaceae bacterium OttesenSCG-928-C18]